MTTDSAHRPAYYQEPDLDPPLARPYLPPTTELRPPMPAPAPARPLRPFLLTGGRVGSGPAGLTMEAQVVSTRAGLTAVPSLGFEHRDIVQLCASPQSLAEISAKLSLHLNVVRVLIGDLHFNGHLAVTAPDHDTPHREETLLRIIRALESIS
ncbi:DUF742 domain-containing protein [Streptomyces sp. NBC_00102]|uniref:DUF742 domain-containing protein n=1 Tax=Streptomyces sp. NBC_00102 TaxID=2975652 RepID=UPI00225097C0|nr:DUF742 domain-containing protein [Streptomyces sp. NBC_00102]MCX5400460.1 DUF742 domain-containing protein [Streptomyces sp. NBC_00102]